MTTSIVFDGSHLTESHILMHLDYLNHQPKSASTDFPCNLPKILIISQTKEQRVRETQSTWEFTTCLVQKSHTNPHCFIGFKKRRRMKNNKHLIVFLPENLFFQKISLIAGFQQNYCSKLKLFSGPDCNFGSILCISPEIRLIESWFLVFFFSSENIAHTVQLMTVWGKKHLNATNMEQTM